MSGNKQSVAFLLGNLTLGGSETKTVRLANRLAEAGFEVHLLVLGPPYTLRDKIAAGVSVELFDRSGRYSLSILWRLRRYLHQHDIAAVVCVNPYPLVFGWPACFLRRNRTRLIGAINTSDLVSSRDRLFMVVYGFILRRCDRIVFGSERQAEAWIGDYGLPRSRATVIYNGVDADYFAPGRAEPGDLRAELEIPEGAQVVGCVAQLRPEKSQRNLLEAVRQLRNRHGLQIVVVLVGEGPERDRLAGFAADAGLGEAVRFTGAVDDVRPYLALFDAFVLPSTAVEVFSNAVLEAMAMHVPVIASDVGGSAEMIEHGESGYVYPRHDVDRLRDYLHTLLTDGAVARRFSCAAPDRVRRQFSLQRMDSAYADLLRD